MSEPRPGVPVDGAVGGLTTTDTQPPDQDHTSGAHHTFTYCVQCANTYHRGMDWTVAAKHTPAERDVTGGIADWSMDMITTPEARR
jgi:hypothetical protein